MFKLLFYTLASCLILFGMVSLYSCRPNASKPQEYPSNQEINEVLVDVNKILNENLEVEISDFINRHGWQMNDTGSGLKYMIYEQGNGQSVQTGDVVIVHYTVWLLTGEKIYTSRDGDAKTFVVGRGGVESGLEEGILMLRVGDKARFIMPPHLAHGFPGDGNKIPRRSPIVYDIELVDIL